MDIFIGKFNEEKIKELATKDIFIIKKISENNLIKIADLMYNDNKNEKITVFINNNDLTNYLNNKPYIDFFKFIAMLTKICYVKYYLI